MVQYDGGPAFPHIASTGFYTTRDLGNGNGVVAEPQLAPVPGLTKRDYFAAAALPALIARHRADVPWRQVAPLAFEIADALIAAREAK